MPLGQRVLGSGCLEPVVWNMYMMPHPVISKIFSIMLEDSTEIIHSLSLTRRTYIKACIGQGAGPSKNRNRKGSKKQIFMASFSFPISTPQSPLSPRGMTSRGCYQLCYQENGLLGGRANLRVGWSKEASCAAHHSLQSLNQDV